jgi:hypothetical protein
MSLLKTAAATDAPAASAAASTTDRFAQLPQ